MADSYCLIPIRPCCSHLYLIMVCYGTCQRADARRVDALIRTQGMPTFSTLGQAIAADLPLPVPL